MLNSIRYNFVAHSNLNTGDLLDDFAALTTALGAPDLAAYADDEDIRTNIEAGNPVTKSDIPATNFLPWFPEGTDLSKSVEISMQCVNQYEWSDHPTNVDAFGNPVKVKGALKRRLFNMIIAGSPTYSLDMSLMIPLLMAAVIAINNPTLIETIKDGDVPGFLLPSGWTFVADPLHHPDMEYGIEGEKLEEGNP